MTAEVIPFLRMEDYPNRIYELRKKRGLSQEALGEAIGVTKMSLSRMERGKQAITLDQLRAIGEVLQVNPADLLSLRDNPYGPRDEGEFAMINRYRAADEEQRQMLERVTEALVPFNADDRSRAA